MNKITRYQSILVNKLLLKMYGLNREALKNKSVLINNKEYYFNSNSDIYIDVSRKRLDIEEASEVIRNLIRKEEVKVLGAENEN